MYGDAGSREENMGLSQRDATRLSFRAFSLISAAALLVVATAGCETDAEPEDDGYPKTGEVTYFDHVKPIYKQQCNMCHQDGGVGPFKLDNLKDARAWGKASANAVANRTMPPWLMTDDGSCNSYQDSRWLSEKEIDTIKKWVDLNMPAGDASKDPGATAKLPGLEGANEYEIPVDYMPVDDNAKGGTWDDYRCFPIDLGLKKDRYVVAADVIPGNAQIVHHVLAFAVGKDDLSLNLKTNDDVLKGLQAKHTDRPGWPCYAAAGKDVRPGPMVIGWAPGSGVTNYPKSTGLKVRKDDILVVQIHYNVTGKPSQDRTKLRLKFVDSVKSEAWFVLHDWFLFGNIFAQQKHKLPAGLAEAPFTWKADRERFNFSLPYEAGDDFEIHGVFPHMHKRGKKMRMMVKQGDEKEVCAADVHHWDFNWQRMYYFDKPIKLDKKTKITNTCTFDTSKDKSPVLPGFGTAEEMCLMGFYISKPVK